MYERKVAGKRFIIAQQELLFSEKGGTTKKPLSIIVTEPTKLLIDRNGSYLYAGTYECEVIFSDLIDSYECHGQNKIQAVHLATDIDAILAGLTDDYDFFYLRSEDPYYPTSK